ncbi:MAG: fructosamine kinase family protein [Leptolyngbyaceae cyanobacterium]
MFAQGLWTEISDRIAEATGHAFRLENRRSVGGGSINQAYQIEEGDRRYFLKVNQAVHVGMFEAEALGLAEMAQTQTILVPRPLCWGTAAGAAYIVMDWLELGRGNADSWYRMGEQLAALHRTTSPQGFGWQQSNTIGETPQPNPWTETWLEFYLEHRLRYQFRLAQRKGGHFPQQEALLQVVPELLGGHAVQPALVHGDLWSGNAAVTQAGEPVILDPATYYGDREVDIAMTELFGRFPQSFYDGYNAAFPLDTGYSLRKTLYNLYHIINHFNLFGGGYAAQANRMIDQLVSASR